ncbi:hypothetical protein [Actinomycetospora termitidis]|uniref:CHAD domain-containing protein n=1 Tax=Actinomycetospora termitidis TaxID=3053470 RepID=A0ABT7MEP1_9PSEU|nr:hypothetical protein [Actinomycetospora sp. Odt1-22]MDL5158921.1 hypothetical protein [Actinomycetospora sp. Odt1-22]
MNPAPTLDPRSAADAALAAADSDHEELADLLMTLEDHRGAALLRARTTIGITARRWDEARAVWADAFADLEAHRLTCEAARERMPARGRLSRSAREELMTLLAAPDGTLTLAGDPVGRTELVARVRAAVRDVGTLLDDVVATLGVIEPLVAVCEADARAAETAFAAFDGSLSTDPSRGLRQRAAALRRVVDEDPLSTLVDGEPDRTPHEALRAEAARATRWLAELADVRRRAGRRLGDVERLLDDVADIRRRSTLVSAEVALKIVDQGDGGTPPGSDSSRDLGAAIERARRLVAASAWEELATVLPALEAEARRAGTAAREALVACRHPLRVRDELRGRLEAYRIKALDLGLAEDVALARLHRHAHDLLWHWPCDLREARRAGQAYAAGVNRRRKGRAV